VANEANTSFPDMTFSGKALIQAVVDDTTPVLPNAIARVPMPPARGRQVLHRQGQARPPADHLHRRTTTVGAASNQNQAAGQDAYDIVGGNKARSRWISTRWRSPTSTSQTREDNQTVVPLMETWGLGVGQLGSASSGIPNMVLDPFSHGRSERLRQPYWQCLFDRCRQVGGRSSIWW
jgi:hypothetical protein